MDLSMDLSRIQTSFAAPTGQLATRRPSTIKAQKLGLKFSSLNGKSVQEVVEVTRRRVKCSATGRKANSNARSEQIDVTPTSVQTIERRMMTDRNVAQEIVTLKGKLVLTRAIGPDEKPGCSFHEFQKNVWFTLVSTELDEQGRVKTSARTQMQDDCDDTDEFYEIAFSVPSDFGEPGALIVDSSNSKEFLLRSLDLKSPDSSEKYEFPCNSWINHKNDENYKIIAFKDQYRKCFNNENLCIDRIFFTNKTYLPKDTPEGLKQLRALEMEALRGDGTGERQRYDRVYDYDVYNDLGNPEAVKGKPEVKAPIVRKTLGGAGNIPYPRRGRTGRRVDKATCMETLPPLLPEPNPTQAREKFYVPRDEDFSKVKENRFSGDRLQGIILTLLPQFEAKVDVTPDDFDTLVQVFDLYKDGLDLFSGNTSIQLAREERRDLESVLHSCLLKKNGLPQQVDVSNIKYPTPQVIKDEPMQWIQDEEFGRQTLSGINPGVIRRAKVFPPKSDLPEDVYGPGTALTAQHIEPYLSSKGKKLTVAEAIAHKRLFTIDYHDVFLPYVNCINSQTDTKRFLYASRAFFFLTDDQKMKPVAIELSLPPPQFGENKPCNRVFTPPMGGHQHDCEWELAKVHFSSIDLSYHELVSHWMECHAVMEPFVIASHRQLSAMHPIFVLLDPCFVNTMRINANARASLIAAAPVGTIEVNFTAGQYGNEMAAVAYDKFWRFDKVGLPEDLLERGMAESDGKPDGVKLLFDDYPYAKDGLDVWNATRDYITSYVKLFYRTDEMVWQDEELQAWWKEIREVGHGDKKDADWWPSCKTVKSLIEILCTIFWMAGPQHATVNFGQYAYAGFMPNMPPMTRMPIPIKNTPEYKEMLFNFEKYMLRVASNPVQTVTAMTTLHVLSAHSEDEEYIGSRLEENWTSNPKVQQVFSKYAQKICGLELMFQQRNRDPKLKNRLGALKTPGYTLLYPTSEPGVTGMGVPWSVSI